MKEINKFYSLYNRDSQNKSEYDIRELADKTHRGYEVAFIDGYGNMTGGGSMSTKTTTKDYDDKFYKKLIDIAPAYNVSELLDHHFYNFKIKNKQSDLFLRHIQYVILPRLSKHYKKEYYEITHEWLTKNNKQMLRKQLEEKNNYLKKAYEEAIKFSPSSPLSVTINPIELGKSIGYELDTTKRIVNELIQDGYLESTIGMGIIMVTHWGLMYLNDMELKNTNTVIPNFNINVGDNSNFQFQQGTTNSSQNIEIQASEKDDYKNFLKEIRDNITTIENYLKHDEKEDLHVEVEYLDKTLNKNNPKKELINTIISNITDILKSVPANVIANIITTQIPM